MATSWTTCVPPSIKRNSDSIEAFLVNSEQNNLKEIMFIIANIVLEDPLSPIRKGEEGIIYIGKKRWYI